MLSRLLIFSLANAGMGSDSGSAPVTPPKGAFVILILLNHLFNTDFTCSW